MKKEYVIGAAVVGILVLGFLIGLLDNVGYGMALGCTEMACPCTETGERPCNGCGSYDKVFNLFIFSVNKVCSATEVLICEGTQQVDTRYDMGKCEYKIGIFGN